MIDFLTQDEDISLNVFTEKDGDGVQTIKNRLAMSIKKYIYKNEDFSKFLIGQRMLKDEYSVMETKAEMKINDILRTQFVDNLELEFLKVSCIYTYNKVLLYFIYMDGIVKEPIFNCSF